MMPLNSGILEWKNIIIALFLLYACTSVQAQLKGVHLLGDYGLQAGTQAEPSVAGIIPYYWYDASKLKNNSGDVVTSDVDMHAFLTALGGSVVTNFKILNANYGASILIPFMSDRIEGNKIQETGSLGFSDMYVQPVQLGWHLKRFDFTAGYAVLYTNR